MNNKIQRAVVASASAAAIVGSLGVGTPLTLAAGSDRITDLRKVDLGAELDDRTNVCTAQTRAFVAVPRVCSVVHASFRLYASSGY